ncbi:MAG: LamG-like jellyroll fold domain-containing protein [Patescibacteria group bacterium]
MKKRTTFSSVFLSRIAHGAKSPLLFCAALFSVSIFLLPQVTYAAYTSDSLVMSLNLSENGGTTVADSSGNSNNGTVAGSPTWANGSVTLDGINDKITVTNSNSLNSLSQTYEAWFTMPDSTSWGNMSDTFPRLIDKTPNSTATGININIDKSTRKVQAFVASTAWSSITVGSASSQNLISSSILNYGTTYHIVFTFDDTTKAGKIYINNILVASATASSGYVSNTSNVTVGGCPDDDLRDVVGTIHRASIYSKALSAAEVSANYTAGAGFNFGSTPESAAVSASLSTMTASTNNVSSNGIASTTITVTAKDYSGNPLSDKTVTIASSRDATDTISPASATTNSSGVAIFTVKSSTSGSPVISATADTIILDTTQTINFIAQFITATDITYTSTLDLLALKMDVSYDSTLTNAPVVIDLHGYRGPYTGDDIIQRLAQKGVFAIKTYKRGYGGSAGTQDDSGREIYDFFDAIEYVKSHYASYIDSNNINVIGYSGGGGNTYGLLTKFPDYFRSANAFFGMSDYGHDATNGWYNNSSLTATYDPLMRTYIGGTPAQVPDNYYARSSYLGAGNNPYTHIQLFYDTAEAVVPPVNATQYTSNCSGCTNIVTRISDSSSTTTESTDDFSTDLSDYSFVSNGATKFIWDSGGYVSYTGDRSSTFSSVYKKFTSLRNYDKTTHIKASWNFTIGSTATNAVTLFGFRNSATTTLADAVSIIIANNIPSVRVDYNGAAYSSGNRDLTSFTTTLSTGTTYGFDLEMNNSVVTATLKNSSGATLETKTVNFNAGKGFDGVDSFGIYNFGDGTSEDLMTGTFGNLSVSAWARWIHGNPQEGTGTVEGNITAENYFVPDMVAGTWSQPVLSNSGTMFIPGYVHTSKFQVFLGNGNDEAGNLTYNISGTGASLSTAKTFTVQGLTGSASIALKVYSLTPSTAYSVRDQDLTHDSTSTSQVTTDSSGTLSFNGTLGSIHEYDVYIPDTNVPSVSLTAPTDSAIVSGASVVLSANATDDVSVAGVQFKLDTNTSIGSEITVAPYTVTWDSTTVAEGSHTIVAVAHDSAGNYATSSAITVHNAVSVSSGGFSAQYPTAPAGGFTATASTTSASSKPVLRFNFGTNITSIAIATSTNFAPAIYINATSSLEWTATSSQTLYIKYCDRYGKCSNPIALQVGATAPVAMNGFIFSRNLSLHTTGLDVQELQKYLNGQGFLIAQSGVGSPGNETNLFGLLTCAALVKFQDSHAADILTPNGLAKGTGYFGPSTRAFVNQH